jgi:hypothetical protein
VSVQLAAAQAIDALLLGAASPVALPLRAGAIAAAAVLAPIGVWMFWGGRDFEARPLDDRLENPPPPRSRFHGFRESLSRPSRTAIGLAALVTAYHLIAYTHPAINLLQVPLERWWVLALGVLIAVWSSLAMDRSFK